MKITIHGKQKYLLEEKSDINIELVKEEISEKKIQLHTIEFSIPKKIPCKMSNPNATYLASWSIEFHPLLLDTVLVDNKDLDFMFDNFSLATQFIVNKYLGTTISAKNEWDSVNQVMYLIC